MRFEIYPLRENLVASSNIMRFKSYYLALALSNIKRFESYLSGDNKTEFQKSRILPDWGVENNRSTI